MSWDAATRNAFYGPDTGWVYFITLGEPPIWVKIGFTKWEPASRMASLQTGCPYPMSLLGFVPGARGLERDLHDVLRNDRRQGEWFEFTERTQSIIADMMAQDALV